LESECLFHEQIVIVGLLIGLMVISGTNGGKSEYILSLIFLCMVSLIERGRTHLMVNGNEDG